MRPMSGPSATVIFTNPMSRPSLFFVNPVRAAVVGAGGGGGLGAGAGAGAGAGVGVGVGGVVGLSSHPKRTRQSKTGRHDRRCIGPIYHSFLKESHRQQTPLSRGFRGATDPHPAWQAAWRGTQIIGSKETPARDPLRAAVAPTRRTHAHTAAHLTERHQPLGSARRCGARPVDNSRRSPRCNRWP